MIINITNLQHVAYVVAYVFAYVVAYVVAYVYNK